MNKIDEQLARIDSMLQQLLSKEDAEGPEEDGGGDTCPTCGASMGHDASSMPVHGKPVGRMLVMVSKKSGAKNGQPDQLPSVLKDVLAALSKK